MPIARIPPALRAVARELRSDLVRFSGDRLLADRCIAASLGLRARAREAGINVEVEYGGARRTPRDAFQRISASASRRRSRASDVICCNFVGLRGRCPISSNR